MGEVEGDDAVVDEAGTAEDGEVGADACLSTHSCPSLEPQPEAEAEPITAAAAPTGGMGFPSRVDTDDERARKDRGPGEASSSFYLGNRPLLHDPS